MNLNNMSQKNLFESYIAPSPVISRCYSSKANPFSAHIRGNSVYDKYLGNVSNFRKKSHPFGQGHLNMPPFEQRTEFCDPMVKIVGGFVGSKSQAGSNHRGREFSLWDVIVDKIIDVMENPEAKGRRSREPYKRNGKIHKIESIAMIKVPLAGPNCLGPEWTDVESVFVPNNMSGVFGRPFQDTAASESVKHELTEQPKHHETEESSSTTPNRLAAVNPAGVEAVRPEPSGGAQDSRPASVNPVNVQVMRPEPPSGTHDNRPVTVNPGCIEAVRPEPSGEARDKQPVAVNPGLEDVMMPSGVTHDNQPVAVNPGCAEVMTPQPSGGPFAKFCSCAAACDSPRGLVPDYPVHANTCRAKHVLRPEAAEFTPRAVSRTSTETESEDDSFTIDVLSSSCESSPNDTFLRLKVQRTLSECSVDSDDSFIVFESAEDDPVILSEDSEDEDLCSDEDLDEIDNPVLIAHNLEFSQPPPTLSRLEEANKKWTEHYSDVQVKPEVPLGRKVKFAQGNELVKVKHLIAWDFAHRAARVGPWEMYHRDAERFKSRINSLSVILSPVLTQRHREKIYAERFQT